MDKFYESELPGLAVIFEEEEANNRRRDLKSDKTKEKVWARIVNEDKDEEDSSSDDDKI
jgi:hypothetical protein